MFSQSRLGRVLFGAALAVAFTTVSAVPAVVWAQMVPYNTLDTSGGGRVTTGNIGGISSCSSLGSGGFSGVVDCVIVFFNYFIYIITALTVVYVIIGAFRMISSEEKREDGKQMIYHGIIGLFVMMSIWGFVNILDSTFRLAGQSPRTPAPIQR